MDELVRIRQFRPAPIPSAAARAQAASALNAAIGGKRARKARPLIVILALISAAALATGAYALYQSVIVGSPAPASVKKMERLEGEVRGELIPQAHGHPEIDVAKTKAAAVITGSGYTRR